MFNKELFILIFFVIHLFTVNVFAFRIEESKEDFGLNPLQVTGDAIKWEIFAKTKENEECVTDSEGFDNCLIKPIYSSQIKELNNKEVTLTGFMFPLEPSEKQKSFLIGPYPPGCPFNYHVSPSQIVEVNLKQPIEFSYDPVTVKGILTLKYNQETGIFYYLNDN